MSNEQNIPPAEDSSSQPQPGQTTNSNLTDLPDLSRLSLEEMEALIARKRLEHSRNVLRNLRAQAQNSSLPKPPTVNNEPTLPAAAPEEPVVPPMRPAPTAPSPPRPPVINKAEPRPVLDEPTLRFRPVELKPASQARKRQAKPRNSKLRDVIGFTLEALVVVAIIIVIGNFVLQQFGLSLDLLGGGIKANPEAITPARAEGPLLVAAADGSIEIPPTPAPSPSPTPTVAPSPTATLATTIRATSTVNAPIVAVATVAPTVTPIIAPTPRPVIVQPVAETPVAKAPFSPPTRLVIPKIGLDTSVVEVTVNLNTWQVADYAVGHHQGTANAGDSSNMVLVGHRDVRGSVFLRLNELQVGDEFKVSSPTGTYRYIVSNVFEVDPSEVGVMAPSVDATATLITCTPIGVASRRLIVKARLVPEKV